MTERIVRYSVRARTGVEARAEAHLVAIRSQPHADAVVLGVRKVADGQYSCRVLRRSRALHRYGVQHA